MRSSSDQTPGPGVQLEARSPTHNPGFQALSKIRKSLREKRPGMGPRRQPTVEDVTKELESVRDDLQVSIKPPWFSPETSLLLLIRKVSDTNDLDLGFSGCKCYYSKHRDKENQQIPWFAGDSGWCHGEQRSNKRPEKTSSDPTERKGDIICNETRAIRRSIARHSPVGIIWQNDPTVYRI